MSFCRRFRFSLDQCAPADRQLRNDLTTVITIDEVRYVTSTRRRGQRALSKRREFIRVQMLSRRLALRLSRITPEKNINLCVVRCHVPRNSRSGAITSLFDERPHPNLLAKSSRMNGHSKQSVLNLRPANHAEPDQPFRPTLVPLLSVSARPPRPATASLRF